MNMSKIDDYRNILKHLEAWEDFLIQESRLPGPPDGAVNRITRRVGSRLP
jgi:hypothetical protein